MCLSPFLGVSSPFPRSNRISKLSVLTLSITGVINMTTIALIYVAASILGLAFMAGAACLSGRDRTDTGRGEA